MIAAISPSVAIDCSFVKAPTEWNMPRLDNLQAHRHVRWGVSQKAQQMAGRVTDVFTIASVE